MDPETAISQLVTDTHRQTQGHGIHHTEHSSRGKNGHKTVIQYILSARSEMTDVGAAAAGETFREDLGILPTASRHMSFTSSRTSARPTDSRPADTEHVVPLKSIPPSLQRRAVVSTCRPCGPSDEEATGPDHP